jgi:N-methylhydantoinase A
MATRIGVDIGGTFTDLVYYDEQSGRTFEAKVPTTPRAPEEGVLRAIRDHVPASVIADAGYFLHGTTVGLNALLERRGATVGLLCPAGFRDVLELRRGNRAEMYNLFWRQPDPLVPRHRRLEVRGRIRADGRIDKPLAREDVEAALHILETCKVDSIAVCLMNAYANPVHELEIEETLRKLGFRGGISLSHRVSGEFREYERTSTTAIDAFVRGRMAGYLQHLATEIGKLGFRGECLITRSGGGAMTFTESEARPFESIMSGPVAGVQGASELSQLLSIPALITADVGGTSFDTALVVDGQPNVLYEGEIGGMPVQTPWVDVRSIGAGGGSIAVVDKGGLMHVGPQSAGADPGPAAYGKGGTKATTTDAAAYLGMLGSGQLASGIQLDFAQATAAIQPLATALNISEQDAAIGVLRIATTNMANAIREITLERGLDPRTMTLLPFGGAGPMMGTLLADELDIRRIVVPVLPGNFSAWGLLGADMVQSVARTRILPLKQAGIATVEEMLPELFAQLYDRAGGKHDGLEHSLKLDLRYRGQEHWLSIDVPLAESTISTSVEQMVGSFTEEYQRTFGTTLDADIEIVATRATIRRRLPQRKQPMQQASADNGSQEHTFEAYSFERRQRMPFRLLSRSSITESFKGPAVITESTATTYLDADWQVSVGKLGELVLTANDLQPVG